MRFPLLIILLSFIFISCEDEEDFSQPFYVDENGVTIKAKDWVTVGTTGVLNGITYTAVDNIKISESDFKSKYPEIIELKQLVTTLVTDMSILSGDYMIFGSFDDFKSIETWDVSNVTSMAGLFNTCNCFNPNYVNIENIPDLTYWDVSSVTNMSGMFYHIYGGAMFNQDISGWDVSNVTNMYRMLMGSNQFNQDLSSWDVSKVTNCDQFSDWTAKWTLPKPNFPISCN